MSTEPSVGENVSISGYFVPETGRFVEYVENHFFIRNNLLIFVLQDSCNNTETTKKYEFITNKIMKKLKLISSLLLCAGALLGPKGVAAHDFKTTLPGGNTLYLNVTDTLNLRVEVTYEGSIAGGRSTQVEGALVIPATVEHEGRNYAVTAIGRKAFSGAAELESVVMPASVKKIGAFAFENCEALKSVTFPAGQVGIGEGAFFRCAGLETLVFGSDWTAIDLEPYKWSRALRVLEVPAKVRSLTNLKLIETLERVYVSIGNGAFSSQDGMLYAKDGKTLYACPRAYAGSVTVPEGVETVLEGAFTGCSLVEAVVLPGTLRKLSYMEFSRAASLRSISLCAAEPVKTARYDCSEVFALRVASPDVVVYVPKAAYKAYYVALCAQAGSYENIDGKQEESFPAEGFVTENNLKKVK